MSCPRPPTRADKAPTITSIAELKKTVGYAFVRGEFARENVMFALKQFEASVRERIAELMKEVKKGKSIPYELFVEARAECNELRKVLGEEVKE